VTSVLFCSILCASDSSVHHASGQRLLFWRKSICVGRLPEASYWIILTTLLRSRRPLLTPWSCENIIYDGWMSFFRTKSGAPFTTIIKLGRVRINFNITLTVLVWKKIVIYTWDGLSVRKSWDNFHFWVNYPFKTYFIKKIYIYIYIWLFCNSLKSRWDLTMQSPSVSVNCTSDSFIYLFPIKWPIHNLSTTISILFWGGFLWSDVMEHYRLQNKTDYSSTLIINQARTTEKQWNNAQCFQCLTKASRHWMK